MEARPLGILACAGPLPIELAELASHRGRAVHVVAIDGFASGDVARFSHERVSLGEVGRILASFRRARVSEIVIAGAMQRPNLLRLKIDWGFVRNLPTVLALTRGGDDSVLRRVVRFFEAQGLRVLGIAEVAPELLAPEALIGGRSPSPAEAKAMTRAACLIADLGPFDIGQGVIANSDGIVAVEGVRGTDAMLRDLGPGGLADGLGRGSVLVKLTKPGQEMRIDLPTIGPETVLRASAAGLAGIGVGAGGAIVLERRRVAAEADCAGLFVAGLGDGCLPPVISSRAAASEPQSIAPKSGTDPTGLSTVLHVAGRRAPTPADRRDIVIGRRLMRVLRGHSAGRAALISREHVLAVSGRLPIAPLVTAHGRQTSWGRRALGGRLGVLVVDGSTDPGIDHPEAVLDERLFRAALETRLAGLVFLGRIPDDERRGEIVAWADDAGVFLCAEGEPTRPKR